MLKKIKYFMVTMKSLIHKSIKLCWATNIGMNFSVLVEEFISVNYKLFNIEPLIQFDSKRIRSQSSEVDNLVCDNSKILKETNWKPKYDLGSAIMEIIKKMKKNQDYHKSGTYNV
jgi:nucleoside-diphosphate-sugar epimerase